MRFGRKPTHAHDLTLIFLTAPGLTIADRIGRCCASFRNGSALAYGITVARDWCNQLRGQDEPCFGKWRAKPVLGHDPDIYPLRNMPLSMGCDVFSIYF